MFLNSKLPRNSPLKNQKQIQKYIEIAGVKHKNAPKRKIK